MAGTTVQTYLDRAEDFARAMKLLRGDLEYRRSTALLAIHSAISYADALRTGLGEDLLASQDHRSAAKALRRSLPSHIPPDRQQHTASGESALTKNAVAYSGSELRPKEYDVLVEASERFALWANDIGLKLAIAGWRSTHG